MPIIIIIIGRPWTEQWKQASTILSWLFFELHWCATPSGGLYRNTIMCVCTDTDPGWSPTLYEGVCDLLTCSGIALPIHGTNISMWLPNHGALMLCLLQYVRSEGDMGTRLCWCIVSNSCIHQQNIGTQQCMSAPNHCATSPPWNVFMLYDKICISEQNLLQFCC